MSATIDVGELRQRLAESVAHLAELEAAAIDAVIGGKSEGDLSALEVKKRECRERIVLLKDAIEHMEHQQQEDAQKRMLAHTAEFMGPLIAPLDEAVAKLALPPYDKPTHPLEPEVIKPKQTFRWPAIRRSRAAIDGTNDDCGGGASR